MKIIFTDASINIDMIPYHFSYPLKQIVIVLFFTLLIGCSQPTVNIGSLSSDSNSGQPIKNDLQASKKLYPDWFWSMPISDDSLFAVGLSETSSLRPEDSENRAVEDAIRNLANLMSVKIRSERKSIRGERLDFLDDGTETEELTTDAENLVKDNHQVIKKFISPDYTFVLIKYGKDDDSAPEISMGSPLIPPKPKWVAKLIKEKDYLYSVGDYPLYYRELDSWRTAEKKAKLALAFTLESNVKEMIQKLDGQMVTISSIATDVRLNNVQIIARWKDEKLNNCYVLIRMKDPTGVLWKKVNRNEE